MNDPLTRSAWDRRGAPGRGSAQIRTSRSRMQSCCKCVCLSGVLSCTEWNSRRRCWRMRIGLREAKSLSMLQKETSSLSTEQRRVTTTPSKWLPSVVWTIIRGDPKEELVLERLWEDVARIVRRPATSGAKRPAWAPVGSDWFCSSSSTCKKESPNPGGRAMANC